MDQSTLTPQKPVLLFDGVCNLCNGVVQAVIKVDSGQLFQFSSLQSDFGQTILQDQLEDASIDSVILLDNQQVFVKSDAVLRVLKILGGWYAFAYPFRFIPRFIRDGIYDWVARNRYGWFGKRESCMIPTPELKDRFLD